MRGAPRSMNIFGGNSGGLNGQMVSSWSGRFAKYYLHEDDQLREFGYGRSYLGQRVAYPL